MSLSDKVLAAYPAAGTEDFSIENHLDERGYFIGRWDESKLGPMPDLASLPEPEQAYYDAKVAREFDDESARKVIKAIVLWCAKKFNLTPAQARAEILAIYKGL